MKTNGVFGAVSFRYMLLEHYKKMGFTENELALLLMIDHLLEQGNTLITTDALALKMTMDPKEIDTILTSLLKRNIVSFETKDDKFVTTLTPLYEKLGKAFAKSMAYENEKEANEARDMRLANLYDFFEDRWSRTLSPLEKATVADWVDAGYTDKEIQDALRDGLREGKVNVRYVDRRLRAKRATSDIEKEGYTATSETWDKDIEESLRIGKQKWEDED